MIISSTNTIYWYNFLYYELYIVCVYILPFTGLGIILLFQHQIYFLILGSILVCISIGILIYLLWQYQTRKSNILRGFVYHPKAQSLDSVTKKMDSQLHMDRISFQKKRHKNKEIIYTVFDNTIQIDFMKGRDDFDNIEVFIKYPSNNQPKFNIPKEVYSLMKIIESILNSELIDKG